MTTAKQLYEFLLQNGGRTISDNSREQRTLIKHYLAEIDDQGVLWVKVFSGPQSYENARSVMKKRLKNGWYLGCDSLEY